MAVHTEIMLPELGLGTRDFACYFSVSYSTYGGGGSRGGCLRIMLTSIWKTTLTIRLKVKSLNVLVMEMTAVSFWSVTSKGTSVLNASIVSL